MYRPFTLVAVFNSIIAQLAGKAKAPNGQKTLLFRHDADIWLMDVSVNRLQNICIPLSE